MMHVNKKSLNLFVNLPFCTGMMPGITEMLEGVAKSKDIEFAEWLDGLKKAGQWHVEVY